MKNLYRGLPAKGYVRHFCILTGFVLLLIIFTAFNANAQSMGVSSSAITPDASSIMELRTTTKGLLIPRMTTTERDAITSPATGLMVYNTTTGKFNFYNGSSWTGIFSAAGDIPTLNQNTTGSAGTLTTSRSIHGGSFNGSGDVTNIIASTYGGTGNGFAKFTGPASSEKTFTLPNASATILTSNALVTIAQGGTNSAATPTDGGIGYGDGTAYQFTAAGTTGQILQSNGTSAPTWVNGGSMMLAGISNNLAVNNTTLFFPMQGALAGNASDLTAGNRTMVSRSGSLSSLIVRLSASLAAGKTGTVTVFKNGVATALAVTLSVGPVTFTDNADVVSLVAGDEISIKVITTGNVKFSWAADFTY